MLKGFRFEIQCQLNWERLSARLAAIFHHTGFCAISRKEVAL